MSEKKNINQEFRLENKPEIRNYFFKKINQIDSMS